METTVTNLPEHKGAFAESMCGGAIYYTPDITDPTPHVARGLRRHGVDGKAINPPSSARAAAAPAAAGSRPARTTSTCTTPSSAAARARSAPTDTGTAKMVYTLDIRKLLAAGKDTTCNIDTIQRGRRRRRRGRLPDAGRRLEVDPDNTSGGPHWGALDNFAIGRTATTTR